jgi:hypothetical protein
MLLHVVYAMALLVLAVGIGLAIDETLQKKHPLHGLTGTEPEVQVTRHREHRSAHLRMKWCFAGGYAAALVWFVMAEGALLVCAEF